MELGLEVVQPVKVKTGKLHEWLGERAADVAVIMAYGRILPPPVLAAPRRGCMNLHASLLPKYRGAAPINWAIVRGETETGVSLMQLDEGLDTGPVFVRRKLSIGPETTAGELAEQIAQLAATVVRDDLPRAVAGELVAQPQDHQAATLAPPIKPEHTRIDWTDAAPIIVDLVRGMAPKPSAYAFLREQRVKVLAARVTTEPVAGPPGQVQITKDRRILVRAGDAVVQVLRAQLENRQALDAADLINGRALSSTDVLS
jgi:methionyl-tRNA formyltransferase